MEAERIVKIERREIGKGKSQNSNGSNGRKEWMLKDLQKLREKG